MKVQHMNCEFTLRCKFLELLPHISVVVFNLTELGRIQIQIGSTHVHFGYLIIEFWIGSSKFKDLKLKLKGYE